MIFPTNTQTKLRLQPGSNGERFIANYPGYRAGDVRINRTNNRMNIAKHEALNQKYLVDTRLKVLFTYGFAMGYSKIVIPKGRIVAADPYRDAVDWDTDHQWNTLTLANGGVPVRLRQESDVYPSTGNAISAGAKGQKTPLAGMEWTPVIGLDAAYGETYFRGLKNSAAKQMTDYQLTIDPKTGNVVNNKTVTNDIRPANKPIGMMERNEYNRFYKDSADGMVPAPIITDAIVELPYFAFKDKAEGMPWGSIYGQLNVGDLVKSDENGRIVSSPLNADAILDTMSAQEIERERQQVIGQVIGLNHDMVPEGGYKWATWALSDRLQYEGFNPTLWPANNRPGEDVVASSAFQSTGRYPGYPYDSSFTYADLHMLDNTDNFDKFMNPEYQYENLGIPGLTDGANAVTRTLTNNHAAEIRYRENPNVDYIDQFIRIDPNGNIVDGSLKITLTGAGLNKTTAITKDTMPVALDDTGIFELAYYNAIQGMIVIKVKNSAEADTLLQKAPVIVNLEYQKKGMAGVPTFMDWDGCIGSAKILLQK